MYLIQYECHQKTQIIGCYQKKQIIQRLSEVLVKFGIKIFIFD